MAGEKRRYEIGYALLPKKENSSIRESLISLAKSRGVDLVKIDMEKPLIEQGSFDCVLYKLYDDDWKSQLSDFRTRNPNFVIIDSPDAIERLHNRISMLQVVSELKIKNQQKMETFSIPNSN